MDRQHPPTPSDIMSRLDAHNKSPEKYTAALRQEYISAEGRIALFGSVQTPGKTSQEYLAYAHRTRQLLEDRAHALGITLTEQKEVSVYE
jgi:hypothetical protein